jgi:hypothetical protein
LLSGPAVYTGTYSSEDECRAASSGIGYDYYVAGGWCFTVTGQGTLQQATGWQTGLRYAKASAKTGDPAGRDDGNYAPLGWSNVVHRSTDGHLHQLTLPGGGGWSSRDLMAIATPEIGGSSPPPLASGAPATYMRSDFVNSVVYRSGTGIYEIYDLGWNGVFWRRMSPRYQPAAGDPAAYATWNGKSAIVYRTTNNDIELLTPSEHEDFEPAQPWQDTNLTAMLGTEKAAGDPMMYMRSDGYFSILYKDVLSYIHEIFRVGGPYSLEPGNTWGTGNLGVQTYGNPFGYTRHDGINAVVCRGSDGRIYEVWLGSNGWNWNSLFEQTGLPDSPTPTASGDPVAYVRSDGASAVLYRSGNEIIELAIAGEAWAHWRDLNWAATTIDVSFFNTVAGNPVPYVRDDGVNAVLYHDTNNHVIELTMTGSPWQGWDLTNASGEVNP